MNVRLRYFAILREQRGLTEEDFATSAVTVSGLFEETKAKYNLTLAPALVRFAVNGEFVPDTYRLKDGDEVVFIPPVAGG